MLHLLLISSDKPNSSKRWMHGLEKNFGRSINTWFAFSSGFQSFFAWQINFPSLSGTNHWELHVWISYFNPSSCTLITSSLWSIIPSLIWSSNYSGFVLSTTLYLIKSKSSGRDRLESWLSFPNKWICEIFPTSAWYYLRENTSSTLINGLE